MLWFQLPCWFLFQLVSCNVAFARARRYSPVSCSHANHNKYSHCVITSELSKAFDGASVPIWKQNVHPCWWGTVDTYMSGIMHLPWGATSAPATQKRPKQNRHSSQQFLFPAQHFTKENRSRTSAQKQLKSHVGKFTRFANNFHMLRRSQRVLRCLGGD